MTTEPLILTSREGAIATVTLNRPGAYNALSLKTLEALKRSLEELSGDLSVRVIIIRGSKRGFSAGHDLKEIRSTEDPEKHRQLFSTCSQVMLSLQSIPQVVIARVHGVATAAGLQLVASCDLAYCDVQTLFGTPGVNIGLFCSTPMVPLSRSVAPKHALELLFTGELCTARHAMEIGLVNGVFPAEELDRAVFEKAHIISTRSPEALKRGKQAFYAQRGLSSEEAYNYCGVQMVEGLKTKDAKEGIDAFLQKRDPKWENAE